MKKRLFQILDEMNVEDAEKGTTNVYVCPDVVSVDVNKSNAHVTMGISKEVGQQLVIDNTKIAVLLVIDKKAYKLKGGS